MNGRTNAALTDGLSSLRIPLDSPTNLVADPGDKRIELYWSDPKDKYAVPEGDSLDETDQLVSEWSHTKIMRKTDSYPSDENDGTVVTDSYDRDKYASSPLLDTDVTVGQEYFYGAFGINSSGVSSPGIFTKQTVLAGKAISTYNEGSIVKIIQNGIPTEYYIASKKYTPRLNLPNRTLLVQKSAIASPGRWATSSDDGARAFINTALYTNLNSTIKSQFSQSTQELIGETGYFIGSGNYDGYTRNISSIFILSPTELFEKPTASYNYEGDLIPQHQLIVDSNLGTVRWTRGIRPNYADCLIVSIDTDGSCTSRAGWASGSCQIAFTLPDGCVFDNNNILIEGQDPPVSKITLADVYPGVKITIKENGVPVDFAVVSHDYETALNGTGKTLVSRLNETDETMQFNSNGTNEYSNSTVDTWLNSEYKLRFSKTVQDAMGTTKFSYTASGTAVNSTLERSIFIPSVCEEIGYDNLNRNTKRVTNQNEGTKWPDDAIQSIVYDWDIMKNNNHWTRSAAIANTENVIGYTPYGIGTYSVDDNLAMRPVFTLPSDMELDYLGNLIEK